MNERVRLLFFPVVFLVTLVHAIVTTEMLYSEEDGVVRALNRTPSLNCLCAVLQSGLLSVAVCHQTDGNRRGSSLGL